MADRPDLGVNCETYRLPAVWESLQRKLFFILTLLLVHRRVGLPQKFRGSKAAAAISRWASCFRAFFRSLSWAVIVLNALENSPR